MSTPAGRPSERIVADLRRQIVTGELAAGDRVPSTREITRRWGVAMATATRALSALRQEGLVRAVTGVGTVVDDSRQQSTAGDRSSPAAALGPAAARRRTASDYELTRARIVTAAIVIADAEGLAGLSMRRVAVEVGAATMSLYRHVADKDDLVQQMLEAAAAEWQVPVDPLAGWRLELEGLAGILWLSFRRHPWLAPALSLTRPQPIASGLAFTERVLAALDGSGLDVPTMWTTHLTLFNYVRGTAANIEAESEAEAVSGLSSGEWLDTQESTVQSIVGDGRLPRIEQFVAADQDIDLDALFFYGLQLLLDGLAARIKAASTG